MALLNGDLKITTCAYDGKVLAADTRYIEGQLFGYCRKLMPLHSGGVFAGSGTLGLCNKLRDAIDKKEKINKVFTKKELGKVCAIYIDKNGVVYWFDEDYQGFIVCDSHTLAIGAGSDLAIGFMRQGYNAVKAIQAVAKTHVSTNDLVDTYNLKSKKYTLSRFPE